MKKKKKNSYKKLILKKAIHYDAFPEVKQNI